MYITYNYIYILNIYLYLYYIYIYIYIRNNHKTEKIFFLKTFHRTSSTVNAQNAQISQK